MLEKIYETFNIQEKLGVHPSENINGKNAT
jgi:hypothetical protein